jgi:hypothetical protein
LFEHGIRIRYYNEVSETPFNFILDFCVKILLCMRMMMMKSRDGGLGCGCGSSEENSLLGKKLHVLLPAGGTACLD